MKPRCKEVLELAQVLIDGEIGVITEAQRLEIEQHLEDCGPCLERHGLDVEVMTLIKGRLSQAAPCPEPLRDRISSLIREV